MTELRPLDTGFIELEDADRHVALGIAVVAVLAGPPPPRDTLRATLDQRVAALPRLRQRVRRAPLDLRTPRWEDDPRFDLDHHLHWTALPRPGDRETLCELIAGELGERLARDRPLWHCVVVEGLAGGRWALIVKAHHSLVDGVSGVAVFEKLCDPVQAPAASPPPRRRKRPSTLAGLLELPASIPGFVFRTVRSLAPVAAAVAGPGQSSSLNGPIGDQRRYVTVSVPLPLVAAIGEEYHVTVNDVVLTAITAGYRDLLRARGEKPGHELRILVPVSMRSAHGKYLMDNRVSAVLPSLPVDRDDAVDRLRTVHMTMKAHKSSGAASSEHAVLAMAGRIPFGAVAWTLRLLARFPQQGIAALATNVPGPRRELFFDGHRVLDLLPAVPIAMRLRTAIAVLSYHDRLVFGITGDYDTTRDIDLLGAGIERAIGELADRGECGGPPASSS
ncbi:wax ester/triacylglycerol synthase family O-acyltransferase [Nocardia sp. NPDC001965]